MSALDFEWVVTKAGCEVGGIIGVDLSLIFGAGHGDIGEAGIYEPEGSIGINIDQNSICGEALGTVTGDG